MFAWRFGCGDPFRSSGLKRAWSMVNGGWFSGQMLQGVVGCNKCLQIGSGLKPRLCLFHPFGFERLLLGRR